MPATAAKLALGAGTGGLALIIGSAVDKKLSGDAMRRIARPCALQPAVRRKRAGGRQRARRAGAPAGGTTPAKPANNPVNALKKLFQ